MSVGESDLVLDRRLSEICGLLPMLRLLTPTNVPEQRRAFLEGVTEEPEFTYLDLPDLDALGGELAAINPEEAADPVLVHMIRGMHRELERRLELLATRNTDQFLLAAVEQYGHVEKALLELAHRLLEAIPPGPRADTYVDAHELAGRANVELDHYRRQFPELSTLVHVSESVAGVMVENGDLFIGVDTSIAGDRVEQLLHHEIGVHVVTYVNGSAQPIRMLSLGLSGYEETQEALGVLAEHLGGGIRPKRLRTFALRVVAADSVSGRSSFRETFDTLADLGAGRNRAFTTAMRAHRSGGMTKDALYLGGLTRLLTYLQEGGRLDPLLVGKISLADEPLVADLLERGVLLDPPLRPRFLESRDALDRLARIQEGAGIMELGGIARVKIGLVVNDVITEKPEYSTTRLALAAQKRGHEVWLMGVGDLAHTSSGEVTARARNPLDKTYRSLKSFLEDVQREDVDPKLITVDDLDVLMLRNDPAEDATDRPWAQASGVLFGQLAAAAGVVVVNDPVHLADAINKTYFQHFPEEIRPRTLISRTVGDIKDFVDDLGGRAVLKPLQGSGGQSVFVIAGKKGQNVNQIIETITRDGYVVVQEFLADAERGDVRLFVMNGKPLEVDGKVAAFRRVNEGDDIRSNMHVGGKAQKVKITDEMLHVVDLARPKLIEDGMFLVGLDIVGPKMMEANVFSPGGLGSASGLHEVDFAGAVVDALERKVQIRATYGRSLPNASLATM